MTVRGPHHPAQEKVWVCESDRIGRHTAQTDGGCCRRPKDGALLPPSPPCRLPLRSESLRKLAETLRGSTGWLLLQVDLKNAFKSIHRPPILNALEQRCPSMMPWVHQAFQPTPLLMGRDVIWSTRGVQLGDPWALSSPPRASKQPLKSCQQVGPSTGGT